MHMNTRWQRAGLSFIPSVKCKVMGQDYMWMKLPAVHILFFVTPHRFYAPGHGQTVFQLSVHDAFKLVSRTLDGKEALQTWDTDWIRNVITYKESKAEKQGQRDFSNDHYSFTIQLVMKHPVKRCQEDDPCLSFFDSRRDNWMAAGLFDSEECNFRRL